MKAKDFELYIKQQSILSEEDVKNLLSESIDKRDLILIIFEQYYKLLQLEDLLTCATQQMQIAGIRYPLDTLLVAEFKSIMEE